MKRKNFSLVWGRKLFFGVGWPILLLVSLGFVLSGEVPETVLSLSLLALQVIAQTGMFILIGYFLLFYPLVFLIPTYYFSRLWGITILLSIIGVTAVDVFSFTQFGLHLNPFIIEHLRIETEKLEWKTYLGLIPVLILFVFLWMRGNRIWRGMQRKFMNTNSSWYIWVILFSFASTQLISAYNQIHYSKYVQNVLEQFPIKIPIPRLQFLASETIKDQLPQDREIKIPKKKNLYPKALQCRADRNLIFVIYQNAPKYLDHLATHGVDLKNHYVQKADEQTALDNLFYSLPLSLKTSEVKESQMMRVLRDYEYHVEFFSSEPEIQIDGIDRNKKIVEVKKWAQAYAESNSTQPFALFLYINKNRSYENTINELIINLNRTKLLDNTVVAFTSLEGDSSLKDFTKVPLVLLMPGKEPQSITSMTTGQDVMPTFIDEVIGCKGEPQSYSFGRNFFRSNPSKYLIYAKEEKPHLWIVDQDVNFSLKELDYFSEKINTSEIIEQRKFYYRFFK